MELFGSSKKKVPNNAIISNNTQLLNTLNEHFQHSITEEYGEKIVPPHPDFYIALQFILVVTSAIAFYINTKFDFDQYKHIQWGLTILFFTINISCYLYDKYSKPDKQSKVVCRNLDNNITYYTKLEYANKGDKWPEAYVVNGSYKFYLKDFVKKDYKAIDSDKFNKLVIKQLVNKKSD